MLTSVSSVLSRISLHCETTDMMLVHHTHIVHLFTSQLVLIAPTDKKMARLS